MTTPPTTNRLECPVVLVAEDSATQRQELSLILEEGGFQVVAACDGVEALELVHEREIDVVLTDIVMPDLGGYDLCRAIRDEPSTAHLPVVLLTSLTEPDEVVRALRAGADGFMCKPADPEPLVDLLRRTVEEPRLSAGRDDGVRTSEVEVSVPGRDSVEVVCTTTDRMLGLLLSSFQSAMTQNSRLRDLQDQLEVANFDLEMRVHERTRELQGEVDERRRAEEDLLKAKAALEASETLYRTLVERSTLGIFRADATHPFVRANSRVARMLGYASVQEVQALTVGDVYPDADAYERLLDTGRRKGVVEPTDIVCRAADDSERTFRIQGRLATESDDARPAFEMTAEDVTRARVLEKELRHAQKMETVGSFTSGIAHDFNNALCVITLNAETVSAALGSDDPIDREPVDAILQATAQATAMTRQLLDFSRVSDPEVGPADLAALVSRMLPVLRVVLPEGVDVVADISSEAMVSEVDPYSIEQVLLNLVTNARDAMPMRGELHVTVAPRDEEWVTMEVRDSGSGIPPAILPKVFDSFFTTKPKGFGTGLGLATVKRITEQYGGFVELESELGEGTSIRLNFPRTDASLVEEEPAPLEEEELGGSETVLLVDDNPSVLRATRRVLEGAGYTVIPAATGEAALAALDGRDRPVDLVITDLAMPGMGGLGLIEQLNGRPHTPPIILASGHAVDGPPGVRTIAKPWTARLLIGSARRAIDDWRHGREPSEH